MEQRFLTMSGISKSGASVISPAQLRAGLVVRLELTDSFMSGFVVYSRPEGSAFSTRVEAQQVRTGPMNLSQLLKGILLQELPKVPGLAQVAVSEETVR